MIGAAVGSGSNSACVRPACADDQLARENSAFFHRNRFGGDIAVEERVPVNNDRAFGHDFTRHVAANFDALDADAPEELHIRFALDQNMFRGQPAGNFAD